MLVRKIHVFHIIHICVIYKRVGWLVALVYSPLYSFNMNVNLQTTNSFGVVFFFVVLMCGWFCAESCFCPIYKKREISENFVQEGKKSFHLIIWLTHVLCQFAVKIRGENVKRIFQPCFVYVTSENWWKFCLCNFIVQNDVEK